LSRRGTAIEPGWGVVTGGLTDAVFAHSGSTLTAHVANLGSVSLRCE
jgi:2-oxo-3-hexenedioate decarboxylase